MKKINLILLLSFVVICNIDSKEKSHKKETCCPGVAWTTKEECKNDEGNFIQADECCEVTFLGKKDSKDQVCCGSCTEDAIEPGVD